MTRERVELRPIEDDDATAVAAFLHEYLNPRVHLDDWLALMAPPWESPASNHGYLLTTASGIVGVYVAVYSRRQIEHRDHQVCNLAAFCVVDKHRADSLRLIRAVLGQSGFEFTDLSPSGNVVALNERLGFSRLDTTTRISLNLPVPRAPGLLITSDPDDLADTLRGRDSEVHHDHRHAPACRHILVSDGASYAYLVFRRDRRKRLPLFATPLYVGGDRQLLRDNWRRVASHILMHHGLPLTLAERRILGFLPRVGIDQAGPRVKMYRSERLRPEHIDYLYSELALLEW